MKENRITISYSTDENFLRYTWISMVSIIEKTQDRKLDFLILVPEDFSAGSEERTLQLFAVYENCSVKIKRVSLAVNDKDLKISHITAPSYYRLLLPDLLPDCEKCIYIDVDTLVMDDISSLYDIELEDNLIAGVPAFAYYTMIEKQRQKLDYPEDLEYCYVNSGVLLMNLSEMRRIDLTRTMIELMDKNLPSQDQDIINYACKGRIKILPFEYNHMTKYDGWSEADFRNMAGEQFVSNRMDSPVIIHYADKSKPWNDTMIPFAEEWKRFALKAPLKDAFPDIPVLEKYQQIEQKLLEEKQQLLIQKAAYEKQIDELKEKLISEKKKYSKVINSKTWKVTKPVRKVFRIFKNL